MAKLTPEEIEIAVDAFDQSGVYGFEFADGTFEAYRYNATFFAPTLGDLTEHTYDDGRKIILYCTSREQGENRAEQIALALDIPVAIINGDDIKRAYIASQKGT